VLSFFTTHHVASLPTDHSPNHTKIRLQVVAIADTQKEEGTRQDS
jgi:hypothetical protein